METARVYKTIHTGGDPRRRSGTKRGPGHTGGGRNDEPVVTYHGHRCARASIKSERSEARVRNETEPATRVKFCGEELEQVRPLALLRTSVESERSGGDETRRVRDQPW